ncbi:MAG: response regulator, partial [Bryobacteraceae bacterium]
GLATVYGIVKQTGGEIVVHSTPGRGSKFEVYLPVTKESEGLESERATGRPRGGSELILLVEDEPEVRQLMLQILEQQGYRVLAAGSAAEAVRVSGWHHGPIDLMVTDVVLPGMDGPALAERMALLRPEMRVIFTSGYAGERVGRYRAPADSVLLEKPFQTDELLRAVRLTLDRAGVTVRN